MHRTHKKFRSRRIVPMLLYMLILAILCTACTAPQPQASVTPTISATVPVVPQKQEAGPAYALGNWQTDEISEATYAALASIGDTPLQNTPWQIGYAGDESLVIYNGRYMLRFVFKDDSGQFDAVDLLENFELLPESDGGAIRYDFSPQGNCVVLRAMRREGDTLLNARFLYDFSTQELVLLYDDSYAEEKQVSAFSPDGSLYAVLYSSGGLYVYDTDTHELSTAPYTVTGSSMPRLYLANNGDICLQGTDAEGAPLSEILTRASGYAPVPIAPTGEVVWFDGTQFMTFEDNCLQLANHEGLVVRTLEADLMYRERTANMVLFQRGATLIALHEVSGELMRYDNVSTDELVGVEKNGLALLYKEGVSWALHNLEGNSLVAQFDDSSAIYIAEDPVAISADALVRVYMAPRSHTPGQFYIQMITRDDPTVRTVFDPMGLSGTPLFTVQSLPTEYFAWETQWIGSTYNSASRENAPIEALYWREQYTGFFRYAQLPGRDGSEYWCVIKEKADADFDAFAATAEPEYVLLQYRGTELFLDAFGVVDGFYAVDLDNDGLEEWLLATDTGGTFISPARMERIEEVPAVSTLATLQTSSDGRFCNVTILGSTVSIFAAEGYSFVKEKPSLRGGEYIISDNGLFRRFYLMHTIDLQAQPDAPSATVTAGSFLIRYRSENGVLVPKMLQKDK